MLQFQSKDLDLRIDKKGSSFYITSYKYGKVDNEEYKIGVKEFSNIKKLNTSLKDLIMEEHIIKKEENGRCNFGRDEYIIFEKAEECPYKTADNRPDPDNPDSVLIGSSENTVRKALEWLKNPDTFKPDIY
ncbi:MAG: hypothetical protein ABIH00_05800 [Armatimonadota bacterium]